MTRMSSVFPSEPSQYPSLLQKSKMHYRSPDTIPQSLNTVTISKVEYERLLQVSYHFSKLKSSLLGGGLSQETLDVLIYGVQNQSKPSSYQPDEALAPRPVNSIGSTGDVAQKHTVALRYQGNSRSSYRVPAGFVDDEEGEDDSIEVEEDTEEVDDDDDGTASPDIEDKDSYGDSSKGGRPSAVPHGQRTVSIRQLPDGVTHQDVVDSVRGGSLLQVYLRPWDHFADVSFVEIPAAQDFVQHAKTHGFYVSGKPVEVTWSDRQFYLTHYVRAKLDIGASRNLVLSNVRPNITEEMIRQDLDHIHNLVVISVKFRKGNAFISTNSINNALYARSCMMSRRIYKGLRIWFYPDECAEPLFKIPALSKKSIQPSPNKPASLPNRFQLLSIGGSEDGEDYDLTELENWADQSIDA